MATIKKTRRKITAAARPRQVVAKKNPSASQKKTHAYTKSKAIDMSKRPGRRAQRIAHNSAKLPETYGSRQLFLVARDPRWLFAHWDFSHAEQHALNQLSADGHLHLRIHKGTASGRLVTEVKIHAESHHWFLPIGRGETYYVAELGYNSPRIVWVSVACSNPVLTPPDTIAPDTSIMEATLPPDVPFQEVLETFGRTVAETLPLVEVIRQFRAAGRTELPEISVVPCEQHWTPAQARVLDRIAGALRIRSRMAGELASLAAAHILPEIELSLSAAEELPLLVAPEAVENLEDLLSSESAFSPTGGWSSHLM